MVTVEVLSVILIVAYTTYAQTCHGDEVLWDAGVLFGFLGTCEFNGHYCWMRFKRRDLQQVYQCTARRVVRTTLVAVGVVLGVASMVFGGANVLWPTSSQSLPTILAAWLIVLAVLVPLDAAGSFIRRDALLWATVTPWCFCAMYPTYLFLWPEKGHRSGYMAVVSIVFTLVGWILWLEGARQIGLV